MRNIYLLIVCHLILGGLWGCQKKHCYSCKDVISVQYWARGTDTIKVVSNGSYTPVFLSDSGYTPIKFENNWQPYRVTQCEVDEHDFVLSYFDSCYITD
jgi:hypothetical protein